jgi:hypothetical protein
MATILGCCNAAAASAFGLETPDELVARELPEEQHLHRNDAVEADLACAIHHAHSTACNFLEQFVVTKLAGPFNTFPRGICKFHDAIAGT